MAVACRLEVSLGCPDQQVKLFPADTIGRLHLRMGSGAAGSRLTLLQDGRLRSSEDAPHIPLKSPHLQWNEQVVLSQDDIYNNFIITFIDINVFLSSD